MKSKTALYFSIAASIWGLTWIAIKFQIQAVESNVAVFYRFITASIIMLALCYFKKISLKFNLKQHGLFIAQGLFMFCLNFLITYWATSLANSSLVALAFTSLIFFNLFGGHFIFKFPIEKKVFTGALISFSGMGFIAVNEYQHILQQPTSIYGFILSLIATFAASIGNLISTKNRQLQIPVLANNAWGMLYGSGFTFLYCLIRQKSFAVQFSSAFIYSFIYLTIFGTIISFWAYQKLIEDTGPAKAAFTSVISPVIALVVSSLFENLDWSAFLAIGVVLCLIGNILALTKKEFLIKVFATRLRKLEI